MGDEQAGAGAVPETHKVTTSTRDRDAVRVALEAWLRQQVGPEADARIVEFEAPESNGMSSETILFDAEWTEDGERARHRLVLRLAPTADSLPVFETYDLTRQYETMRRVARHTDVPVPEVLWNEAGLDALGAPFFVMRRVDGIVPPDVMPYTFGSWVTEATPAERERLVDSTVEVLAKLGSIPDPLSNFDVLRPSTSDAPSALRRHVDESRRWMEWSLGGERSPLLDRCFAWLDEHWPDPEPEPVVSWGDSRIGNVMYADFRPVAVLDWEMAALAPREVDLAWFIFLHRFFDDLATSFGLDPMPAEFIERGRVERRYAELTGYEPRHMDWFLLYAATRHGIVFTRTSRRAAHLDDTPLPDDPDDVIMHRASIEAMLDGTYWSDLANRG